MIHLTEWAGKPGLTNVLPPIKQVGDNDGYRKNAIAKVPRLYCKHPADIAVSGIFALNTAPILGFDEFIRNVLLDGA